MDQMRGVQQLDETLGGGLLTSGLLHRSGMSRLTAFFDNVFAQQALRLRDAVDLHSRR